ncbi:MAG: UDP-N-acetylmuramoyl-tripeptide--D-alanyl-D-alanine ligase [Propionibacteriaceae bacterium]|nr:UDP-N-acetylmuramoyl-tripeptide--D-alanyl-D-alanine ligase [Propionibacteriaceae bacterium]
MWIAVVILAYLAAAFAVNTQMHMFQLNTYDLGTHLRWLKKNRSAWVLPLIALTLALLSFVTPVLAAILLLIWFAITIAVNFPRRRVKKPLVYTTRVIRMLVTIGVVAAAFIVLTALAGESARILTATVPYILSPVWVIIANWINTPIEYGVRQHYLNDAKRMLAAHPRLITIGITGSYGKTSLKYYLATLLRGHFNVLMTPESYNTPMGITKTIRGELRATHEVFVCEMGAEHIGEIAEDCRLVNPTIGVITAIGEQHLASFGSQEAILQTKMELAEAVRGKGMLYLNGDDPILAANQPDQERSLYGFNKEFSTYSCDIKVTKSGTSYGTSFTLFHRGKQLRNLETGLIGTHNIQNLTGASAVALDLGVTEAELRTQLRKLAPAPHRLAISRTGDVTILDDAYNSNPAGAKAALDTLAMLEGTKILITPGMVQLGAREEELNEAFGVQAAICDHVFLVGEKQTQPIARGLLSTGYDPAQLTIVADVQQAISAAYALNPGGPRVILLENDLPDNY